MRKSYALRKLLFLGVFLLCGYTYAQTVTGTVSDANGALPGAAVVNKTTGQGVTSDFDGNYSIEANSGEVLEFSFVGMTSQSITVGDDTVINITLIASDNTLDEVVVVGYTSQTRGDITGSVASVDMEEATKVPVTNAAEALQGRVTGVTVSNNAAPGAAPKVTIRGFGTTNSTDPLYIIDGVQTTDANILNSINPTDIAQMNVLKDGAAAIYGARASNGVIIVTTKSGGYNQDKARVTLDVYTGFSSATNLPDLMSAEQHKDMIYQSLVNDGADLIHPQYDPNGTGTFTVPSQLLGVSANTTVNPNGTNWPDEIVQNAPTSNIALSLANGTETGQYFMSVNYLNRDGILKYTGFERIGTTLNSEFKVKDKIKIGEHLNVAYTDANSGNSESFQNSLRSNPLIPTHDNDGNFAGTYSNSAGLGNARNPLAQLYRGKDDYNRTYRIFGDVYLEAEIIDGLTFKTSLGATISHFDRRAFSPLDPEHSEPVSTQTLTEQDQNSYEWVWSNTLNYNKSFGDHSINALLGVEAVQDGGKGKIITRTGYLFEDPDFYNLGNGSGTPNVSNTWEYKNSLFSIFGSINYDYKGKYFLTATLRNDKSSRFAGSNKSDIFPSFSAGWLMSKEDFYPSDFVMDRVKFKASYGQMGNQSLPIANPTLNISVLNEQYANYAINGGAISTGAILNAFGNPNIKWETSESTNFGIELGFFDSKLTLDAEYYIIDTEDLITQDNSLISTTAIDAAAPYVNFGSVRNTGIDFNVGFRDATESGWSYGINFNLSHYKNEVTDLISAFALGDGGYRGGAITRTEVGRPISSFYGRVVEGLDGSGRFIYKDISGDGIINDEDRTYIGSPHPDFTYGLNLDVGFKGFDVSAFFIGSQGNDIYNYNKIYTDFPTFFNGNRSTRLVNSWTPSNTNTSIPALSQTITNAETNPNSYFVEDGSFFRLKNLQIGYTFDSSLTDKIGLDSFRIYAQGTNLFTVTDYSGMDPEVRGRIDSSGNYDNLTLGVDNQLYPMSKIYTLGLNVKF